MAADARNAWVTQDMKLLKTTPNTRDFITTRGRQGVITRHSTADGRLAARPLSLGEIDGLAGRDHDRAELPMAVGGGEATVGNTYDDSVTRVGKG